MPDAPPARYGEAVAYVFCNGCGHRNPPASAFCSSCGGVLDHPEERTISIPKADPLQDAPGPEDNVRVDLASIDVGNGVLVVRSGPAEGERFILKGERVVVGRNVDCDIVLDDVTVSRRHATLCNRDGTYSVHDEGSLNGTYVNQARVEERMLAHGDELQIGKFRMVFFDGKG